MEIILKGTPRELENFKNNNCDYYIIKQQIAQLMKKRPSRYSKKYTLRIIATGLDK